MDTNFEDYGIRIWYQKNNKNEKINKKQEITSQYQPENNFKKLFNNHFNGNSHKKKNLVLKLQYFPAKQSLILEMRNVEKQVFLKNIIQKVS